YVEPEARKRVHKITSRIFNELTQEYNQNGETNFDALGSMHFVYYIGAGAGYLTGINLDSLIEASRKDLNTRKVKVKWKNGTELSLPVNSRQFHDSVQHLGTR